MDPLSLSVSVVALLGACNKLITFLTRVYRASKSSDRDIQTALNQIESLTRSTILIKTLEQARSEFVLEAHSLGQKAFDQAWQCIHDDVVACKDVLDQLQAGHEKIQNDLTHYPSTLGNIIAACKLQLKEAKFLELYKRLSDTHRSMNTVVSAVQLQEIWASRTLQLDISEDSRLQFSLLHGQLDELKASLESATAGNLRRSFAAAKAIAVLGSSNKHFDIPQPVSPIFTGYETRLRTLQSLVFSSDPELLQQDQTSKICQRCFIIHGLGGSGKTQFCCKFASENRERFWGVFWIDGSSRKLAEESFARLAGIIGVEDNARAAKRWLSCCEQSWLLIIDNADDADMELEDLFPENRRGFILITTRNPDLAMEGTVGPGYFNFSQGEPEAACRLLLRAAHQPKPWDQPVLHLADGIAFHLGYLPLAIIMAGRTILKRVCSLQDYIHFHDTSWRKKRERAGRRKSDAEHKVENDPQVKVYATCDLMYRNLAQIESRAAQDAIELLKIFSFLHRENICLRMLLGAAQNLEFEKRESTKAQPDQFYSTLPWFRKFQLLLKSMLAPELPKNILPDVLQSCPPAIEPFDEYRLREALSELSQRSLIMYHPDNDSYLVHPIIHHWVRERPEMRIADQALWCRYAETIIAHSILLPPHASSAEDNVFHRSLLPHILSVRRYEDDIQNQFDKKNFEEQGREHQVWYHKGRMTRTRALAFAKFSLVFTKCGQFPEALALQTILHEFFQAMVGQNHPTSIRIQLALAGTYWHLGQGTKAAELQENAMRASTRILGSAHSDTLRIIDSLGTSRWMQGRFAQALDLHEVAVKGLEHNLGPDHADVLIAKDHLGRVMAKYFRFEEALQLHLVASEGLRKCLGEEHEDTLVALDNTANVYMDMGTEPSLLDGQAIAEKVLDIRKNKLGAEHYYTLWSMLTLARIRAMQGAYVESEAMMQEGLSIAYQTIGTDHMGVLNGRLHLAWVHHLSGRTQLAIDSMQEICTRQGKLAVAVRGHAPDRFMAMYMLAECYRSVGRYDDGINTCADTIQGILDFGGQNHPFLHLVEQRMRDISREREDVLSTAKRPEAAPSSLQKRSVW